MLEAEKSLKRLKTDRIDLYFIHHFDHLTPIDESLRALTIWFTRARCFISDQQLGGLANRQGAGISADKAWPGLSASNPCIIWSKGKLKLKFYRWRCLKI